MKTLILFSFILLLYLFSCNDNPSNGGDNPLALSLTVTDSNAIPIAGVDFHYIFYVGLDVVYRNAAIEFSLPVTDTVTLCIYDPFKNLIATPCAHQVMPAGEHVIFFDADTLTNGVYEYRIIRPSSTKTGAFFIRTDDPALLKSLSALTQTDQKGKLTLNYSTLGIGYNFLSPQSELGYVTISDSISVLLFKSGYHDYSEGIKLNTATTTKKTIQLASEN